MATSTAFKKFLEAGKNDSRVLGPADRYVLTKPRDDSRRTDVLHPSEMSKYSSWCHRAAYFQITGEAVHNTRQYGLQTHMVFEEGHMIHDKWQRLFAQMGVLYGTWMCARCDTKVWGMAYPECPNGHGTIKKYKEVPLILDRLHFGGAADGWLIGLGEPMLLEIKSVGEGTFRFEAPEMLAEANNDFKVAWKNLKTPFSAHIYQAQIYLKLIELINEETPYEFPVPQEICFLYEAKPTQETKEFFIPKSDFGITEIFAAAEMIARCVLEKTPPVCNIMGAEKCKNCKDYQ